MYEKEKSERKYYKGDYYLKMCLIELVPIIKCKSATLDISLTLSQTHTHKPTHTIYLSHTHSFKYTSYLLYSFVSTLVHTHKRTHTRTHSVTKNHYWCSTFVSLFMLVNKMPKIVHELTGTKKIVLISIDVKLPKSSNWMPSNTFDPCLIWLVWMTSIKWPP